ncbi:MAG: hypothetical protein Q9165_002332 [Trypethelium subeluteriae]
MIPPRRRTVESEECFDAAKERRPRNSYGQPSELTVRQWSELQSQGFRTREQWQHQRDYKQWLKHWAYNPENDDPEDLLYRPGDGFTYERCHNCSCRCGTCHRIGYHDQAIVVSIEGVCRKIGTRHAAAAYGVFFAPESDYNGGERSSEAYPTTEKAEMEAAIEALWFVQEMWFDAQNWDIERVIIKTDSDYVVKAMTVWVYEWNWPDYVNSEGLPALFVTLHGLISELNRDGFGVQFWHVPRRFNTRAEALANKTLDEVYGLDGDRL